MSQRRKYTKEFRVEAVRMANTAEVTLKQMGEELDSGHLAVHIALAAGNV